MDKPDSSPRRFWPKVVALAAAIFSVRIIALILHASGLEKIYKPGRFGRRKSYIDQQLVDQLPKYCQTITGRRMDPINLLFVGSKEDITEAFARAGWHGANPASPWHLIWAGLSVVMRRSHQRGPFTPLFMNVGLQDMAFQKLTELNSFKQRHHIRIWRSGRQLPDGRRIWIAAASFDTALKIEVRPPFIHHKIDSDLDSERGYVVSDLVEAGAREAGKFRVNPAISAGEKESNAHGDRFFTDGEAIVLEVNGG